MEKADKYREELWEKKDRNQDGELRGFLFWVEW